MKNKELAETLDCLNMDLHVLTDDAETGHKVEVIQTTLSYLIEFLSKHFQHMEDEKT